MQVDRKKVLLGLIVLAVVLYALPVTRDELEWRWADSRDQAVDFMRYYTDWPHGRHVVEAHLRYNGRMWADTKRAMIREAYKKNPVSATNSVVRQERRAKLEKFFWNQVAATDAVDGYKDYLLRYPNGPHAAQAQSRLNVLDTQPESATNAITQ